MEPTANPGVGAKASDLHQPHQDRPFDQGQGGGLNPTTASATTRGSPRDARSPPSDHAKRSPHDERSNTLYDERSNTMPAGVDVLLGATTPLRRAAGVGTHHHYGGGGGLLPTDTKPPSPNYNYAGGGLGAIAAPSGGPYHQHGYIADDDDGDDEHYHHGNGSVGWGEEGDRRHYMSGPERGPSLLLSTPPPENRAERDDEGAFYTYTGPISMGGGGGGGGARPPSLSNNSIPQVESEYSSSDFGAATANAAPAAAANSNHANNYVYTNNCNYDGDDTLRSRSAETAGTTSTSGGASRQQQQQRGLRGGLPPFRRHNNNSNSNNRDPLAYMTKRATSAGDTSGNASDDGFGFPSANPAYYGSGGPHGNSATTSSSAGNTTNRQSDQDALLAAQRMIYEAFGGGAPFTPCANNGSGGGGSGVDSGLRRRVSFKADGDPLAAYEQQQQQHGQGEDATSHTYGSAAAVVSGDNNGMLSPHADPLGSTVAPSAAAAAADFLPAHYDSEGIRYAFNKGQSVEPWRRRSPNAPARGGGSAAAGVGNSVVAGAVTVVEHGPEQHANGSATAVQRVVHSDRILNTVSSMGPEDNAGSASLSAMMGAMIPSEQHVLMAANVMKASADRAWGGGVGGGSGVISFANYTAPAAAEAVANAHLAELGNHVAMLREAERAHSQYALLSSPSSAGGGGGGGPPRGRAGSATGRSSGGGGGSITAGAYRRTLEEGLLLSGEHHRSGGGGGASSTGQAAAGHAPFIVPSGNYPSLSPSSATAGQQYRGGGGTPIGGGSRRNSMTGVASHSLSSAHHRRPASPSPSVAVVHRSGMIHSAGAGASLPRASSVGVGHREYAPAAGSASLPHHALPQQQQQQRKEDLLRDVHAYLKRRQR